MGKIECCQCYFYAVQPASYPCSYCEDYDKFKAKEEEEDNVKYDCFECDNGPRNYWKESCRKCDMEIKEQDNVNSPEHYKAFPVEVIDIIKYTLTTEQFKGYCLGNEIKYRMRAGIKNPEKTLEDIQKAEVYRKWRNEP